jgi:hypothetical protein
MNKFLLWLALLFGGGEVMFIREVGWDWGKCSKCRAQLCGRCGGCPCNHTCGCSN